jgi:hypothetical protein
VLLLDPNTLRQRVGVLGDDSDVLGPTDYDFEGCLLLADLVIKLYTSLV